MTIAILLCAASVARAGAGVPVSVHALENARIVVGPGRIIEKGTIVIRDGRIEAVGASVAVPADARVWDLNGATVHAGFIDPYVTVGRLQGKKVTRRRAFKWEDEEEEHGADKPAEKAAAPRSQVSSANPKVHPDTRVADFLAPRDEVVEALREQGFVLVQAVPDSGIFRGTTSLYSLGEEGPRASVLREESGVALGFDVSVDWDNDEAAYPSSMMGNVALMRQTFADAAWYREVRALSDRQYLGTKRPQAETALVALQPVVEGRLPVVAEAETLLEVLRLHRVLDEAGVARRATVLSGEEWRRLDWVKAVQDKGWWIVTLDFPAAPRAKSPGEWLAVETKTLRHWRNAPAVPRWLTDQEMRFALSTHRLSKVGDFQKAVRRAVAAGLDEHRALDALTLAPAVILGVSDRFGTLDVGKAASLVVRRGGVFDSPVREVWIEGRRIVVSSDDEDHEDEPKKAAGEPFKAADYGQAPAPWKPEGGTVLVRGATVWTQGPQGVVKDADLLVVDGRVRSVGRGLSAPASALVVDGRGLHVTPGLVDAHSHTAVEGDINEATLSVTAQVRIKDVINPFDRSIYLQLAGGVTTANVMHGSANAIGGQVVTVKWKWGASPDEMLLAGVPEGIKFALGENPKQSNWGDKFSHRYPQTRMGVAALIRERFAAAREYRRQWNEFLGVRGSPPHQRDGRSPVQPRRDLQLEALLEILDGKRLIQCHSYRQDEILALIRMAEEEGFKVKTFQHVLEGYKVADEMARHGAMASTFSDWWAYKYEVMDAIPHNGALMASRGVVVSFNSDSPDHARRLNTEAAKAVRYGGLGEEDALAFVTLNAARQLGAESRIGSLEAGKDGDFVVWSAHPLSQQAIALQTFIEGRRYFDRAQDEASRKALEAERKALVQRAKSAGKKGGK